MTKRVEDAGERAGHHCAGRRRTGVLHDRRRRSRAASPTRHRPTDTGVASRPEDPVEAPHGHRHCLGDADARAADPTRHHQGSCVSVYEPDAPTPMVSPTASPRGGGARSSEPGCGPIEPAARRPAPRRARRRRPARRAPADTTSSMLPATSRAATPASGNPMNGPQPPGPSLDLEAVPGHGARHPVVGAGLCSHGDGGRARWTLR